MAFKRSVRTVKAKPVSKAEAKRDAETRKGVRARIDQATRKPAPMPVADRMAKARAARQAKIAASAKPDLTLKEVKAEKAKKIAEGQDASRVLNKKHRSVRTDAERNATARLVDTAIEDLADRTQKSLKEASEKETSKELVQPAGHGPVGYYYIAECLTCGSQVRVPVDERGRRIPIGDMRLVDGVLSGKPEAKTKSGRAKRAYTDEERKAIADRLQGARAAKLGLTLEGLRALRLRPGAKPTPAQLKKYGIKGASRKARS